MSPKRATIADVAKAAGISIGAVSRILNKDPTLAVREETREAVYKAMSELGYSPNPNARSLRMSRTNTLAMVLPEMDSPAFTAIIQGAQRAATSRGYSMLLGGVGSDGDDPQLPARLLKKNRVDGFLVSTGLREAESFAVLKSLGAPSVLLNRYLDEDHPHVILDDEGGVDAMVRYLIELGHRRIGFLGAPERFLGKRRFDGYAKALREAGISVRNELVVDAGYSREGGERGMGALLGLPHPPTAIFATNHLVAAGAIMKADTKGLSVPRDLSVASFYDGPVAELVRPPLTAVRYPLERVGSDAVNILVDLIEGKDLESTKVVLRHEQIVVRESTSKPA